MESEHVGVGLSALPLLPGVELRLLGSSARKSHYQRIPLSPACEENPAERRAQRG